MVRNFSYEYKNYYAESWPYNYMEKLNFKWVKTA
jgi:hypothetical protein